VKCLKAISESVLMAQCLLGFIISHNDIKTGTAWKIQIEVSHVEFQQKLKDDLRDTIKVLRKMGFIINQYITKQIC
jgi:DNA polymerase IIIc chi subunit